MPQEPEGELDLSNLDALLSDLENDLESGPQPATAPPATPPPSAETPPSDVVAPPAAPEVPAVLSAPPPEPDDAPSDPPEDELMAAPIPQGRKDEDSGELDEMFTDDEEPAVSSGSAVEEGAAEESPMPAPVPAAPAPPAEELSFEDALELDEEPPPAGAVPRPLPPPAQAAPAVPVAAGFSSARVGGGLPPPLKPGELPESPTVDLFMRALKGKNYERAAEIGLAIRPANASAVFRQNLAGALFYAGQAEEAEQELVSLLEEFPYAVSARRNLEIIRSK